METGSLLYAARNGAGHVRGGVSYKYVAPNGAAALLLQLSRRAFGTDALDAEGNVAATMVKLS